MQAERFMLVATVKDEGPNILEWVAYHRLIGFDDIVIYQNNSFDMTEGTLLTLARMGIIRYFNNDFVKPGVRRTYQNRAYRRASRLPEYAAADWCMALDGDEFLVVRTGEGRVADLVQAMGPADQVRVNWRLFGSNGETELSERLVSARFDHGVDPLVVVNHPVPVKTLFRTSAFTRAGIHLPKVERRADIVTRTGSGRLIEEVVVRTFQNTDPEPYALAQVNHYMLRDAQSFLLKSARGSSSHNDRDIAHSYWSRRNINLVQDTTLSGWSERIWAEMARLDALSGGKLMRQRQRSLRQWRLRVRDILATEEGQALYGALTG